MLLPDIVVKISLTMAIIGGQFLHEHPVFLDGKILKTAQKPHIFHKTVDTF